MTITGIIAAIVIGAIIGGIAGGLMLQRVPPEGVEELDPAQLAPGFAAGAREKVEQGAAEAGHEAPPVDPATVQGIRDWTQARNIAAAGDVELQDIRG